MTKFEPFDETDKFINAELESIRLTTVATYTAVARCAQEVADLNPHQQVATLLQVIRELTLMVDDIVIDNDIDEVK